MGEKRASYSLRELLNTHWYLGKLDCSDASGGQLSIESESDVIGKVQNYPDGMLHVSCQSSSVRIKGIVRFFCS